MGTTRQRVLLAALLVVLGVALGVQLPRWLAGPSVTEQRGAPPPPEAAAVELVVVARGLDSPVDVVPLPDGRLLVVQKGGLVRVLRPDGAVEDAPWLDVTDRVSDGSEQGLLGLALARGFPADARAYVSYTDREGTSRVEELRATPDAAEPAPLRSLLRLPQPYGNHNGGHLTWGPDGHLWLGLGDGGRGRDPHGHGQNRNTLLGTLLSFDVGDPDAVPRVRVFGVRNPWRFAFDPASGDLFVADVGQDAWEEVTVLPAGRIEGANLGWAVMEGTHCLDDKPCDKAPYVAPIVDYGHDEGCSITGGVVVRDPALPALAGAYLYGDFCSGHLWSLRHRDGALTDHWSWTDVLGPVRGVTSFGVDGQGRVLVLTFNGVIRRLQPRG